MRMSYGSPGGTGVSSAAAGDVNGALDAGGVGVTKGVVTAGVGEASGAAGAPQAEQRSASMHSAKKQYSFFSKMAIDLSSM